VKRESKRLWIARLRTGALLLTAPVFIGCGARTGLDDDEAPLLDGAAGAPADEGAPETFPEEDATPDQGMPPVHVSPPVVAADCADAGATLIYVIANDSTLLSFYPPTATFHTIGQINCTQGSVPNSMAVDQDGTAYVGFTSGNVFRVSTATAGCQPTTFAPGQDGFPFTFGMAFAGSSDGGTEALYVAGADFGASSKLASIDTTTFSLHLVGVLNPPVVRPELTGTAAGDLFAFFAVGAGSAIAQVNRASAQITAQSVLTGVNQGNSYAFAIWGGDFYTFTGSLGGTLVTRFRPNDQSIVQVAMTPESIVGAGVSTCAPQM
jgi:hypothetical protein